MNQLCKVCGEPAAGFHFGAFTCEGCKSFFGRTYNNISAIAGCKNNGDCVINKKNRTACKACRLRKCLLVGMSKSGSRYGRRSNWFKIHCLLQEQQTQQQLGGPATVGGGTGGGTTGGGGSSIGGGSGSNFEQLARLHQMQARQTYQDKTNPCIKSASMSPTMMTNPVATAAAGATSQLTLPLALGQCQGTGAAAASVTSAPAPTPSPLALPPPSPSIRQHHHFVAAAAKFLNGVPAKNEPRRLTDTPSDSGASSADEPADGYTSTPFGRHGPRHHQHQNAIHPIHRPGSGGCTTTLADSDDVHVHVDVDVDDGDSDIGGGGGGGDTHMGMADEEVHGRMSSVGVEYDERELRRKQFLQIFRSHSEPLRSHFAPFALSAHAIQPTAAPPLPPTSSSTASATVLGHRLPDPHAHAHLMPAALKEEFKRVSEMAVRAAAVAAAAASAAAAAVHGQDEPIDLSLKSLVRDNQTQHHRQQLQLQQHGQRLKRRRRRRSRHHASQTPLSRSSTVSPMPTDELCPYDDENENDDENEDDDGDGDSSSIEHIGQLQRPTPLDLTLVRSQTQTLTG